MIKKRYKSIKAEYFSDKAKTGIFFQERNFTDVKWLIPEEVEHLHKLLQDILEKTKNEKRRKM